MLENYILEELNEVGEIPLALLIPKYLEIECGKELKLPIMNYNENYNIDDIEFLDLFSKVMKLFKELRLGLYLFKKGVDNPKNWKESFILIANNEAIKRLSDKNFWVYPNQNKSSYFLAETTLA